MFLCLLLWEALGEAKQNFFKRNKPSLFFLVEICPFLEISVFNSSKETTIWKMQPSSVLWISADKIFFLFLCFLSILPPNFGKKGGKPSKLKIHSENEKFETQKHFLLSQGAHEIVIHRTSIINTVLYGQTASPSLFQDHIKKINLKVHYFGWYIALTFCFIS